MRVHKVTCAVDCGWIVNPDTIKAQMEGGVIYGLSAALRGEITIDKGRVVQSHFGDYQVVRIQEIAGGRDVHRAEHRGARRDRRAEHGGDCRVAGERRVCSDRQADLPSADLPGMTFGLRSRTPAW